jgi:hypothetical protein
MPRRYPAGGSYRGQYNNYQQQPSIQQYESFFNPIPIEFLQEQLGRRQGQYDVAFAGALGAKDALAQQQVGMADIASKNQIIQEGMTNIDKLVEEKYGGDWGRASKEVARSVTQMRSDPFWNAQKEMEKRRASFEAQAVKAGAKGMIFGADPRQMTTLDLSGKVRGMEELTGRVVEAGDWLGTARGLMAGLTPDKNPYGLTQAEIDGFLRTGSVSEITRKKIEKFAGDPAVQETFLREHPEFREGFEQLDPIQKRKFGLEGDDLTELVKQQLLGASASAEVRQVSRQYMQDPIAIAAAKKASAAQAGAYGPVRELEASPTSYGPTDKEGRKQLRWNFNMEGSLLPGAGKLDQITYNSVKGTVDNLRQENPELSKDMTDYELYEDYLNDPTGQKYKFTIDRAVPILNEDVQINMGKSLSGNINGTEWYLDSGDKVTDNWQDRNGLGNVTGIPLETMTQLLQDNQVPMGYNETKGSHYLEVPIIDGDIAKNSDGSVNWNKTNTKGKKRIYFAPDMRTKGISTIVQSLDQLLKDPSKKEEFIKNLPPTILFDESRLDEKGDVNNQEVFKMKNAQGEDEYYSLNEIRRQYKMISEQHILSNYGADIYE